MKVHRPGCDSSHPLQGTALCPQPEYQKDEEAKTKDTALGPQPEHFHDQQQRVLSSCGVMKIAMVSINTAMGKIGLAVIILSLPVYNPRR